jgi:hypothetical protein
MEENNSTQTNSNSNGGKTMSIAGLVLGILATILALVPCLGMWAIVPGVIGLILSAIAMMQAGKTNSPKGMAIAGLICSIIGICIAAYWIYVLYFAAATLGTEFKEAMEKSGAMDSLAKALEQIKEVTDTTKTH